MTHQYPEPLHVDAAWREFSQLVEDYATKQVLPDTVAAALDEVHAVIQEIELCQQEGHAPDHHDIAWRVGYLMFCLHQVERVGLRDGSAHTLVTHFLDEMGVPFDGALDIALVRLRSLQQGEDMVQVDTRVLVPIMKRHLHRR